MTIIGGTPSFYIFAEILCLGFVAALIYGALKFNWAEWTTTILVASSVTLAGLGTSRVFGRDGCHSGLHGIPFLEQTESWFLYLSLGLFILGIGVGIFDDQRKKKIRTCQSS